jgi:dipeptidyl aminopeptidase/acylaminoacyl peptidase
MMFPRSRRIGAALLFGWLVCGIAGAQETAAARNWTIEDSVERRFFQTKRLHPYDHASRDEDVARFSPDGEHFFVVSFRGDLSSDQNVFELSVYSTREVRRALQSGEKTSHDIRPKRTLEMASGGRFLHDFAAIYLPEWQGSQTITFVGTQGREFRRIYLYDIASGDLKPLSESKHWIADTGGGEYVVRGSTTMFRTHHTEEAPAPSYPFQVLSPEVLYTMSGRDQRPALDATHWRFHASYKGAPSKVVAQGRIDYSRGSYVGGPWISPDERWAVLLYRPEGWVKPDWWSSYEFRAPTLWYLLIDLQAGTARPISDAPLGARLIRTSEGYAPGTVFWSSDSRHVLVANLAQRVSGRKREETRRKTYFLDYDLTTGKSTTVNEVPGASSALLTASWKEEGRSLLVKLDQDESRRAQQYSYDGNRWKVAAAAVKPPASEPITKPFSIGVEQSSERAPALVVNGSGKRVILRQAESLRGRPLAPREHVQWTDPSGKAAEGFLLRPGKLTGQGNAPVVVQFMNTPSDVFAPDGMPGSCDVAQSLVGEGFVVLQLVAAGGYGAGGDLDTSIFQNPKEFPTQVVRVDSAMDMLRERGISTDDPIGLTGFSRTGLYVYYVTTHPGRTRIGAAIVCDSMTNGFGEYIHSAGLYGADESQHYSLQFGNGKAFWENKQGWFDAPDLNLERLRTPILFHTHGNPITSGVTATVGAFLLARRPFEFHYYPDAGHVITSPRQQAAAMQATVDWMRFWLQNQKPKALEDPERFSRWQRIRTEWESVSKDESTAQSPVEGATQ